MDLSLEIIWIFFSYFGDFVYWLGFGISFLLIYPFLDKRDREKTKWILQFLIPSIIISYFIAQILKNFFQISRPCIGLNYCPSTYSFPSGHSTIAFAWITSMLLAYRKKKIAYLFLPIPFLVGISRIMLNVHTIYDVVGGEILGISISSFYYLIVNWISKKNLVKKLKRNGYYFRKLLHLLGIFFVFSRFLFGQSLTFFFLLSLAIVYTISEIFRIKKVYFPWIQAITEICSKKDESKKIIKDPIYFLIGLSSLNLFDDLVFYIGAIALIIGDGFAGLIGKHFGKHKIVWNKQKSWEGFLAFFGFTFAYYLIYLNPIYSLVLAFVGAFLESTINEFDNLALPIVIGILIKVFISL
ncbi:MAG: hypothetical protein B6U78_01450 [Candidatus Aenigmarchaeota archaeon ex4484_224]|nr:MAG: hypothetical protein B6U78_01450 [Candidatus Aenigmarchaeota archaeon ex4484_224]